MAAVLSGHDDTAIHALFEDAGCWGTFCASRVDAEGMGVVRNEIGVAAAHAVRVLQG